jgi:hypothetical protein
MTKKVSSRQGVVTGFLLACLVVMLAMPLGAAALTVDIYGGFDNTSPSGTPYSGLVGSFISPDIMFATSTGYNWHPFGLSAFGADINGALNVATTGSYTFSLNSDDGSLLFIDGILAINNGGPHGPNGVSNTVLLTAGQHPFEVQFYEDFGGQSGVDLILPNGVNYSAVPEPGTLMLLSAGLFGLAIFGKRRMS